MRLLSGNPGMYQHSIEQNTEGETTQQEPEHGEDTIARVKGHFNISSASYDMLHIVSQDCLLDVSYI